MGLIIMKLFEHQKKDVCTTTKPQKWATNNLRTMIIKCNRAHNNGLATDKTDPHEDEILVFVNRPKSNELLYMLHYWMVFGERWIFSIEL